MDKIEIDGVEPTVFQGARRLLPTRDRPIILVEVVGDNPMVVPEASSSLRFRSNRKLTRYFLCFAITIVTTTENWA